MSVRFKNVGAFATQMTGSGPTVFALSGDYVSAKKIYDGLEQVADKVFLTHTSHRSIVVIK